MTSIQMVCTGAARIEVLIDGHGPAVVLIPSSQRDSLHEATFVGHLAQAGFRVLRPQPRGMGHSAGPLDGMSLADLAGDIAATIDACGRGRAVVLGHAFGHTIARMTDLCHPDKVRGVGLLAAASREAPAWLFELLDRAADAEHAPEIREQALKAALFAPGNSVHDWMQGWHPHLRPAYRQAARVPGRAHWWPVSNAPILDLQGAMDLWRPAQSRTELSDVLGSQVTIALIEGAGHALLPERPFEAARAIASWMRGLAP